MATLPNKVNPKDKIKASVFNQLLDYVRSITPRGDRNTIKVSSTPGGSTISRIGSRGGGGQKKQGNFFIPEIISGESVDTFKVNNIAVSVDYLNRARYFDFSAEPGYDEAAIPDGFTGILNCYFLIYHKLSGYSLPQMPYGKIVLSYISTPGMEYPCAKIFRVQCENGRITNIMRYVSSYCPCNIFDNSLLAYFNPVHQTIGIIAIAVNSFSMNATKYIYIHNAFLSQVTFDTVDIDSDNVISNIRNLTSSTGNVNIIECSSDNNGWGYFGLDKNSLNVTNQPVYYGSAPSGTPVSISVAWRKNITFYPASYEFNNRIDYYNVKPMLSHYVLGTNK